MKTTVRIIGITAFAALAVFFTACFENFGIDVRPEREVAEFIPVDHIIGIPTGSRPGLEIILSGTVMPSNATNKRIVWSITGNGAEATLERNRLSTSDEGNVTVTATIKNGSGEGEDYTQDFNIVISSTMIAVGSITGIPETLPAGFAGDYELRGRVSPSNAINKTILWSVKDAGTTGASIYGNILTIESPGTVVITATVADGRLGSDYTQDFAIVIPYIPVTDISGIPDEVTMGDYVLHGVVTPSNAINKTILWSVTDAGTTGAEIVNGNTLRTTATGTAVVRAAIANGVSYGEDFTKDFTITISIIAVTNITGIPSTLARGDYELNGVVTPSGASNAIVWTVANAGATNATINGNILNTTAVGTVTIRATIANGVSFGVNYTKDFTITVAKIVYAAGNYNEIACYWRNGELFSLGVPAGTSRSYATDIVVVNNIPYIAGYYSNNNGVENACYWVNGELKTLPKTTQNAKTRSIAVDGSTVYIFGEDSDLFCYWKIEGDAAPHHTLIDVSGIREEERAYDDLHIGGFAVDNGNVYIPIYYSWKVDYSSNTPWQNKNNLYVNGNFTELDLSYSVNDIAVLNGTVYMAGILLGEDYEKPCYWVMGESSSHILDTTDAGEVDSIVVQNGALWFYGKTGFWGSYVYCYWNASGAKTDLPASGTYDTSIVAYSDGDRYIAWYEGAQIGYGDQKGYRMVGGSFTQLFGAGNPPTTNVHITGIAVQ